MIEARPTRLDPARDQRNHSNKLSDIMTKNAASPGYLTIAQEVFQAASKLQGLRGEMPRTNPRVFNSIALNLPVTAGSLETTPISMGGAMTARTLTNTKGYAGGNAASHGSRI